MKGRSHRLPPSVPLEDWGDGQWTVDCSCGVTFDDGEEMVSCDECGVWVHTRCSRYVRGEASFACHNCKAVAKRSRTIVAPAANSFAHDTEETEVAQLLVELPTKTDRPPPIPLGSAPYRPPFRLWAHVPMEDRVHVQGVPGGDPSLFRGLSSSIFSPELWKCTGYVPKKFNFKYKEFPCWEEEERDKASRGADALFSLSKETVQTAPARTSEKILPPDGTRKNDAEKVLLGARSFGCVKKERNKLRVLGSSKGRKEESVEEKEFSGRKRPRGDFERTLNDAKEKAASIPMFDSIKEDFCEDEGLQIAESDVPDTKSTYKKEDILHKPSCKGPDEGLDNGSKPKHMLVFKTSRRRLSDEALRPKLSLETPVKVEKVDRLDGRVSSKLNTVAAYHVEGRNTAKGFTKQEDSAKLAAHIFKEPKDESHAHTVLNGGSTGAVDSEKLNSGICSHGSQPDVTDITFVPPSAPCFLSTQKVEISLKVEATDDQALQNSDFPLLFSSGKQCGMDDLPQNQLKTNDSSSITAISMQSEKQKPKDPDLSQTYQERIKSTVSEPKLHELIMESAGSLTRLKDSIEPSHVSKIECTAFVKSNCANLSHSAPPVQKLLGIGKDFLNSPALIGSKSSTNAVSSSLPAKTIHVVKPHRIKVTTTSSAGTAESEHEVSPQPPKVHPSGAEFIGSKSLDYSKEQLPGPSQTSAENPTSSSGTVDVQSQSNQLKSTTLGSSQKTEKTSIQQSSSLPASKFLSHSLTMQTSSSTTTTTTTTTTLSDEELALLLHQELNSSPRVPRVPRMRQTTNMQFATPSTTTSTLSKRSYSGGREQVSFFRRKHKEDAVRHSPEPKQEESAVSSDSLCKRGRGSRSYDALSSSSSKTNVAGTCNIEGGANSFAPSPEENGAKLPLRTSAANVDGDGTLVGRSLPCLIDEIMGKGKCSTYGELCDAVRPYWHSLRKPNGERYAYSSYSLAVLDCLRNRSEWAHLIDRGPKTNASKRRRKLDSESPVVMELENERSGNPPPPHTEDFPKGKRNVRKRRLLETGVGGAMKVSAKGTAALSDEDPAALSHSSNGDTGADACSSSSSGDSD